MTKNAFYFTFKNLFVLKIFKFCLDFFVKYRNGLIRKIRLVSKLITSKLGKKTIEQTINISLVIFY